MAETNTVKFSVRYLNFCTRISLKYLYHWGRVLIHTIKREIIIKSSVREMN